MRDEDGSLDTGIIARLSINRAEFMSPRSMGKPFDELAKDLTDRLLSWDPALATQVGWHKYDRILRDPSRRALEYQVKKLKEFVRIMEQYSDADLSEEQRIDRDLALHIFKLKLFEISELKLYTHCSFAADEIGNSLFFLFVRDVPPYVERIESIVWRIERIPRYLEKSKETLNDPYYLWNEVSLEAGRALPSLINEIRKSIRSNYPDPALETRASRATEVAVSAIEAYNSWLQNEILPISSPRFTVTPSEYETYLGMKGFDVTKAEILEIGRKYLIAARRGMEDASRSLSMGNVDEAIERMRSEHPPSFSAIIEEYRRSAALARSFVVERKLATVPEREHLKMMETPEFMRPVAPLAGQFEPGKFDNSMTGLFILTPDESNPGLMKEHSYAVIGNTTAHEAYPGHHLQGLCSNRNPSWIRTLISSPEFSEGWGLYSEELMLSEGYNDNPMGRLANLNDFVFRLCRQIAEVDLPSGATTLDEATEMLRKECHMDPAASRVEIRSCAMNPTYYIAYFIGMLAILQLRDDVKAALGKKFTLKFFHDSLLYAGCMPMSFMRRAMALRVKQEFGIDLGPPRESLYRYAMKRASASGPSTLPS